jgi:adenine-specific DNA methylase
VTARKKKEEDLDLQPKLALTPEQYWRWRTSVSEMNEAKKKLQITESEAKVLGQAVEIAKARLQLHIASTVRDARDNANTAKSEYFTYKRELEESLGTSLNGKAIDEITFEVRDLEEDQPKLGENNINGTS